MKPLKKVCAFCGKPHSGKLVPNVCSAKGQVMSAYLKEFKPSERWKVFNAVESGLLNLDNEAAALLMKVGLKPDSFEIAGGTLPWEARASQLKLAGLNDFDIANKLNAEGFRTARGKLITETKIRCRRWYVAKEA